jgi:O-antigen ligase
VCGVAALAITERPRIARPPFALLDGALVACLAAVAVQLAPIPASLRHALSPAAADFDRAMRLDAPDPLSGPARPLSLDPASTAWALFIAAAIVVLFWSARTLLARGGIRRVARATAWIGLVVSAIAIVQHATAPNRLYWYLRPEAASARPYGPFVNRNDLACWLVMAIPLTLGYGIARVVSRRNAAGIVDAERAADPTAVGLIASLCLMLGALLVTQSRSGITAGAAGLLAIVLISRARMDRTRTTSLLIAIAAVLAVAAAYANLGALANRVGDVLTEGMGGRRAIWRETWVMIRDFWATGVGAGAYERGMLVYQTSPRQDFYFNHAHSEYLQLLSEGGLLLCVPVVLAVVAGAGGIARRLREDRSAAFWIRAGAASGLVAVAIQSVWETGLQRPANAVLFAILAAVALHGSSDR